VTRVKLAAIANNCLNNIWMITSVKFRRTLVLDDAGVGLGLVDRQLNI
jgi:hypothetical protein